VRHFAMLRTLLSLLFGDTVAELSYPWDSPYGGRMRGVPYDRPRRFAESLLQRGIPVHHDSERRNVFRRQ
jgi:hypothetical protein